MINKEKLKQEIAQLEAKLKDLKQRLPKHTTPAEIGILMEMDKVEDELEAKRKILAQFEEKGE